MRTDRFLTGFAAVSFAGMAAAYFFLPESVPIHWSASGEVDRWGGKANVLWMGALPLLTALLLRFLPRIDPRHEAYARHAKSYDAIKLFLVPSLAAFGWIGVAAALGVGVDAALLTRAVVGVLLVGTGNYLGKLKRNFFVGIKTPWALADDEVWRLTHRRGGYVFVAMGLAFLVSLLLPPGPFLEAFLLASSLGGVGYACLYSYLAWRRLRCPGARVKDSGRG